MTKPDLTFHPVVWVGTPEVKDRSTSGGGGWSPEFFERPLSNPVGLGTLFHGKSPEVWTGVDSSGVPEGLVTEGRSERGQGTR